MQLLILIGMCVGIAIGAALVLSVVAIATGLRR